LELGDPDSLQQLERLLDSLDGLDDVRSVNCNLAA
jgi:transcriptional/translational regulatory protein YebC/TACO1